MPETINMHEAKTHLSKLVEQAVNGEPFVIARSGKPLVKVTAVDAVQPKRIGFLTGKTSIPADFDTMAADEIAEMFGADPE